MKENSIRSSMMTFHGNIRELVNTFYKYIVCVVRNVLKFR